MKPASTSTLKRDDLDWPVHVGVKPQEVIARIRQKAQAHDTRRRRIRRATASAAVLALALFTVFWGVPTVRDTAIVATAATSRQTLELRDGSRVELNAQTSLKTDFRYGRRTITLSSGEAFFSVAKEAAHPFLVETPAGTVRVTGTQFNVRLTPTGQAEVTLLEGGVEFESGGPDSRRAVLKPSHQLSTSNAQLSTIRLSAAELDRVTAWRDGRLILDGLSLAEVIERLVTYHGKPIAVAPDAAKLQADGAIALDNLAGALDALQVLLPINVLPASDGTYRIIRR